MTKKTDPHILDLKSQIRKTADTIRVVIDSKPHVTDEMRARYDTDRPEFDEIINKTRLWDGYLSWIKGRVDDALMKATQIDVKPSVPMANAHYPGQVTKVLRMVMDAKPPKFIDKALVRLAIDDPRRICSSCGLPLLIFKSGNRIDKRTKRDVCMHSIGVKARLIEQEKKRAMQDKSDAKTAKRKAKENRGKPDPEYVKAMETRKKALRKNEGAPSREERRKSRGF